MDDADTAVRFRPRTVDPVMARAQRILRGTARFDDRYAPDHAELLRLIETLRSMDCVIAFVTGVWDLFHIGHGDYLQRGKDEAAKLYDGSQTILVVGIDIDDLARERKEGIRRPIVPLEERARVLGHLRAVDIIVPQYEANQLFALIPHEVRVLSQTTRDLPDLELIKGRCEHVVMLPPQAETSTTARIRQLALDGQYEALTSIVDELGPVLEKARAKLEEVTRERG